MAIYRFIITCYQMYVFCPCYEYKLKTASTCQTAVRMENHLSSMRLRNSQGSTNQARGKFSTSCSLLGFHRTLVGNLSNPLQHVLYFLDLVLTSELAKIRFSKTLKGLDWIGKYQNRVKLNESEESKILTLHHLDESGSIN